MEDRQLPRYVGRDMRTLANPCPEAQIFLQPHVSTLHVIMAVVLLAAYPKQWKSRLVPSLS